MMNNSMMNGDMMSNMGIMGFVAVIIAILVVAALVKYVFFR